MLGVFEANRTAALARGWLPRPWQLVPAAGKGVELAGYLAGQLRHRIPYRLGRAVIAAHGTDRVESVTVASLAPDWSPIPGTERRIAVDAVCVSHGFTPRLELPIAAGCALTEDRFVRVDADQRSSVRGVYAAGEITGIGGVDLALAEGQIAGHAAAGGHSADHGCAMAVRRRDVFRGFAARIEAAHGIRQRMAELAHRGHHRLPLRGGRLRHASAGPPRAPAPSRCARSSSAPGPDSASARAGSAAAPSRNCSPRRLRAAH